MKATLGFLVMALLLAGAMGQSDEDPAKVEVAAEAGLEIQAETSGLSNILLPATPRTPWDVISASPDHNVLKALIELNGLVGVVNRTKTTVFAPVDSAFTAFSASLPNNTILNGTLVKNILAQHVLRPAITRPIRGLSYPTLNSGNPIRVPLFQNGAAAAQEAEAGTQDASSKFFFTNATDLTYRDGQGNDFDVTATIFSRTAAVYVTSTVLLPNNAFGDISTALDYYNLNILANLTAGSALDDPSNQKTLFGPTDRAFQAIAGLNLTQAQVAQVLLYHVVFSTYTTPWMPRTITLSTGLGQNITLRDRIRVRDTTRTPAYVRFANIWFPGGVLQVINKVLIPTLA